MLGKRTKSYTLLPNPTPKRRATNKKYAKAAKPYGKGYQPVYTGDGDAPELKWHDVGKNLTVLDTAPSAANPALYYIGSLCAIQAGDNGSERNGTKIQAKKITLRMKVAVDPNSDGVNANIVADAHTFRVFMAVDTQGNGASPTFDQIFENVPNNDAQEFDFNKLSSTGRFKVLLDKFITVPPSYVVHDGTNYHAYGNNKFFKKTFPLDMAIRYSDASNNVTSVQKNNIFLIIMADASTTTFTNMKFAFRSRLRFKDY